MLDAEPCFVFGSNELGRHGKGAGLWARQHRGAVYGQGEGHQGNSYAIPTKSTPWSTLPMPIIRAYVSKFLAFATEHADMVFQVTPVGCGHAGYQPVDIAPMFKGAPPNCLMPDEFKPYL